MSAPNRLTRPSVASKGAGDAVEQRGLACAVRADQHAPLARCDGKRNIVDRAQSAENFREPVDGDRGRTHAPSPRLPERQRAINPMMPCGAHSTVTMNTMPSTAV